MVLGNHGRGFQHWLFSPLARGLVRLRVSPDAVTFAGTIATIVVSMTLFPTDHLVIGSLVVALLVLLDSVDGIMARMVHGNVARPYGEFLDSTLDRLSDGAIFAGVALWFVLHTEGSVRPWGVTTAIACLAIGGVVSYARAKAQALGVVAKVGLAERADRLIVALVATFAVGLGLPPVVLVGALALLSVASLYTVGQRMALVRREVGTGGSTR